MVRLLDIVDMQVDFMHENGLLSVAGAEPLIARANDYFRALPDDAFDVALFKYDTHFAAEYPYSPESVAFPHIHCEYGTAGWELAVDDGLLAGKLPVFYMAKNMFDMWAENPLSAVAHLRFDNEQEAKAYRNLYRVSRDRRAVEDGTGRDDFLRQQGDPGEYEVTMIGVASDFCVHDAMAGYLARGARVSVIADLVCGIGTNISGRAQSGHIRDVMALPLFAPYIAAGQLRLI